MPHCDDASKCLLVFTLYYDLNTHCATRQNEHKLIMMLYKIIRTKLFRFYYLSYLHTHKEARTYLPIKMLAGKLIIRNTHTKNECGGYTICSFGRATNFCCLRISGRSTGCVTARRMEIGSRCRAVARVEGGKTIEINGAQNTSSRTKERTTHWTVRMLLICM